jgi:uridine kinase
MYCSNKNDCRLFFIEDPSIDETSKKTAEYLFNVFEGREGNIIISIAGPGGSGKSTFANQLSKYLTDSQILHLDDYRKPRPQRIESGLLGSNPAANNVELLIEHIKNIRTGISFNKPLYNPVTGSSDSFEKYSPQKFNILEGELSLSEELIGLSDFIVILNCSWLIQFNNRFKRDTLQRRYSIKKAIAVFIRSNILDFIKFYRPNYNFAHLIIKRISKNRYRIIN